MASPLRINPDPASANPTPCLIRPLHPGDVEALFELVSQPSLLNCGHFEPAAELPAFQAFAKASSGKHHRLVAVVDGRPVGLGLLLQAAKARMAHVGQINLVLPPGSAGLEAGSSLLRALLDLAQNWLNLKRLEADIPAGATELQTLLQQAGFTADGVKKRALFVDGDFQDEIAMARLNGFDDHDPAMRPPAPAARQGSVVNASELLIRPLHVQDADDLYEMFRAPVVCRTTLQLPSQELWLTRERIDKRPPGMRRLVALVDQRAIGTIGLTPYAHRCRAHSAGLGMMVHPDYWGQGIGSRLMERALDLADRWLNLKRVDLEVHSDNTAGVRLYEKFGFVVEGTKRFDSFGDGGWADALFMARITE